jgi:hypothetical protein
MYTDPEEARSDLLLSGAVYVFGPLLLGALGFLFRVPVLGEVLLIVAPLLTTIVVPVLLARYRKERLADYGFTGNRVAGLRLGLILAAPLVLAIILGPLFARQPAVNTVPALFGGADPVAVAANAAGWVGLTGLALYATVKARDAFRLNPVALRPAIQQIGSILGIVAGVAALLLLIAARGQIDLTLLLVPLGAAAAVALLWRQLGVAGNTTKPALITPVVLLAIRPLNLLSVFGNPLGFLESAWLGAFAGAIGLLVGATLEGRGTAWPAVALGVTLALLVPLFF